MKANKYILGLYIVFLLLGSISTLQVQGKISSLYSSPDVSLATVSVKFESQGKVTRIIDGDTIEVDGVRIRLALVDTPERDETGYEEATRFTASLCSVGATAYLDIDDGQPTDKYGRTVAVVYCGGKNLNAVLWKNGYARINERFLLISEFDPSSWS